MVMYSSIFYSQAFCQLQPEFNAFVLNADKNKLVVFLNLK